MTPRKPRPVSKSVPKSAPKPAPKSDRKPARAPTSRAARKPSRSAPRPAAPVSASPPDSLLQLEDEFYRLLAGGTKVTMLLTLVDSGLAQLLFDRGALSEDEIVDALELHRGRAHKLVLLLRSVGLLVPEESSKPGEPDAPTRWRAAEVVRALVDPAAPNHFFYRDFLRYWRIAAAKDHVALLKGAKVTDPVRYPPVLWEDVLLLHDWMRDGALVTLAAIERRIDFGRYHHVLDVAGGDATMAIALARKHPRLEITVFNLPAAAALCRRNIAAAQLGARIKVVEGDFRIDSFPALAARAKGYDLTLFSRVMADWDSDVCRMLMQKARAVLQPHGHLLLAEPLRDENPDLSVVWEHSYLPYDDFGAYVYKLQGTYEELLGQSGFRLLETFGRDSTIHSVLLAERIG